MPNNQVSFKTPPEPDGTMEDWFATDSLIKRYEAADNPENDEERHKA